MVVVQTVAEFAVQQGAPHAVEGAEEPVVRVAPSDGGRWEAVDRVTVVVADSGQHQRVREGVPDEVGDGLVSGYRLVPRQLVDVVGRVVSRPQDVGDVLETKEHVRRCSYQRQYLLVAVLSDLVIVL